MNQTDLVRYSQISPKALLSVLIAEYELKEPVTCRFFDSGVNDIYVVTANDKKYYLRLGMANRYQRNDYEEEVRILLMMQEHGIAVASPVIRKDGSYVWSVAAPEGERFAILLEEAKRNDAPKDFYLLGAMIATMHNVTDEQSPKVSRAALNREGLITAPLACLQPYLLHRTKEYENLKARAYELYDIASQTLRQETPQYGFCHGDLHSGNIFFADCKPVFIDFDCMGYGYRAYDLCIYAWNEAYSDKEYLTSKEWGMILSGYDSIRKMSQEEKELIPAFMAIRQVWLMGLHAQVMDINAGCCWFHDGYFTEQIGLFDRYYEMYYRMKT